MIEEYGIRRGVVCLVQMLVDLGMFGMFEESAQGEKRGLKLIFPRCWNRSVSHYGDSE